MNFLVFAIIYITIMIIATIVPNAIPGEETNYSLHFLQAAILTILLLKTFETSKIKKKHFYSIFLSILIIVIIEFIQFLIPYRTYNNYDIFAGVLGSFIVFLIKIRKGP